MTKVDPKDLLEFPCNYQFKAVGAAGDPFRDAVIAAVDQHACVDPQCVRCRPSGKGAYQAVSVHVDLEDYEQLMAIYAALKEIEDLKMLL